MTAPIDCVSPSTPTAQRKARSAPPHCSEIARILLMHAVGGIFQGCGNSYANAYTEKWLTHAKSVGAYHGRVIGVICELEEEWETWLDDNGGLPDFPNAPSSLTGAK